MDRGKFGDDIFASEIWENIRNNDFYRPMIEEVKKSADKELEKPGFTPGFLAYNDFFENGNRVRYEKIYFNKRRRLNAFTLMYKVTGEKKYKDALYETIWDICNEYTWALPAHVNRNAPSSMQVQTLDLFACETGFALSEIYRLFENDFDKIIKDRIEYEVRRRIITSFLQVYTDNWWEHEGINWSAVCSSGIAHAFMYLGTESEFEMAEPRIINCANIYIDGFLDDGACLEGYGYWTYGFSFFTQLAESLRRYTNGEINLFENEKVHKIAAFSEKVLIGDGLSLMFSDVPVEKYTYEAGLVHKLHNIYKDLQIPDIKYRTHFGDDDCYRFGTFIRNFTWMKNAVEEAQIREDYYFKESGWFIKNSPYYSFAIKAGNNDEPHNHNDIGAFHAACKDKYVINDLGAGEYTAESFNNETRYKYISNSSLGHSVPVIGGKCQKYGKEYYGTLNVCDSSHIFLNMEKAYGIENLLSLRRDIFFDEKEFILEDLAVFSDGSEEAVKERFVTKTEPKIQEGTVLIDLVKMVFDAEKYEVLIEKQEFANHQSRTEIVYFIDFMPKEIYNEQKFKVKFIF